MKGGQNMQLQAKEEKTLMPYVRENPLVLDALAKEAKAKGVSTYEAVRQLVRGFVADPFPLSTDFEAPKSSAYGAIRCDKTVVDAFRALATEQGLSCSDAMRAVVHHFLRNRGHL
jgi:hypothetical protein